MQKKTLVILAAGIGSRYGGGVKQLEPVGPAGELIIDYSVHDAIEAGFNKIVFIIRHDIEADFRERIGDRVESICVPLGVEICYAFQEMNMMVDHVPEGRVKPWGTGHAVLCAADRIDSAFAVINADDYYGKEAYREAVKFLDTGRYGIVAYVLKNTISANGGVTRGICSVEDGKLVSIAETRNIIKSGDGAEADGIKLDPDSYVSMNFMCYPVAFLDVLKTKFSEFLADLSDPLRDEFLLPKIADRMLKEGTQYALLTTNDRWFGVTYKEDKASVVESFKKLYEEGVYERELYGEAFYATLLARNGRPVVKIVPYESTPVSNRIGITEKNV